MMSEDCDYEMLLEEERRAIGAQQSGHVSQPVTKEQNEQ